VSVYATIANTIIVKSIFTHPVAQLVVPIIYMLLWSEYNYSHALELSKVPR